MSFLCYDIRGIQNYIFAVPRLKVIVGGSTQIDDFDQGAATITSQWDLIFSGGGRGAFRLKAGVNADSAIKQLESALVSRAHQDAMDIQIGVSDDLDKAATKADRFHPFFPKNLAGVPCPMSGLYPVSNNATHPQIQKRLRAGTKDKLGRSILNGGSGGRPSLLDRLELPEDCDSAVFFRSISDKKHDDDDEDSDVYARHAECAFFALGGRSRMAIITMDVNDLGRQSASAKHRDDFADWLTEMSQSVKKCTDEAFIASLANVLNRWIEDEIKADRLQDSITTDANGKRVLVLPARPLILAGDELTILLHCDYAVRFVHNMITGFDALADAAARDAVHKPLWPASGDRLTISAGVLFSKVTVPLHVVIDYSQSLLKSAKGAYRKTPEPGEEPTNEPTVAAIDFDVVTDTMIDTPVQRRDRDLCFEDPDRNARVYLTNRPYHFGTARDHRSWKSLEELIELLDSVPPSVRSDLMTHMRRPWSERAEFLISIGKRHKDVMNYFFREPKPNDPRWHMDHDKKDGKLCHFTGVADAVVLLEESRRAQQGEMADA